MNGKQDVSISRSTHSSGGRSVTALVLFAMVLALGTSKSLATILIHKDLDDLTTEAQGVVVGTVAKTESVLASDGEIYTLVTFEELDVLYGRVESDTLVLQFLGGEYFGQMLEVIGSPRFTTGDRVVVFVGGNGESVVPVVGWTQGVYRLRHDTGRGEEIVTDYETNPVLRIEGSRVIRRERFEPEAEIIDVQLRKVVTRRPPARARSLHGNSGEQREPAGGAADRGQSRAVHDREVESETPAMTAAAFIAEIDDRLQKRRGTTPLVKSVAPDEIQPITIEIGRAPDIEGFDPEDERARNETIDQELR